MQHGNRYEPVIDKNTTEDDALDAAQTSARATGFGAELRRAREEQGISLGDMAVRSRLSVAQLRALENEEVEKLPEPVYVRAFIRGCAQSLGLDAQALVNDYVSRYSRGAAHVARGQVPDSDPADELVIGGAPRHRTLKVALIALLVAAVAAGIWTVYSDQFGWASGESEAQKIERGTAEPEAASQPAAPAAATEAPVAEVAPTEPQKSEAPKGAPANEAVQPPAVQQLPAAPAQSAAPAAPAAGATPAAAAPAATPAPTTQPQQQPAANVHRVEFEISAPVWVQVISPQGRNLVAREMHPGDRFGTEIPAGSRFTIGNADAVKLTIDGKPFSLDGTIRNGISRFSVE